MKYTNSKLGFSFELPEGWLEQQSVLPPTFTSSEGVIQVKAATILPSFTTPAARKAFMAEPGFEFLEHASLGDETDNVVRMWNRKHNEGWLSAVRGGIHYEITWDPYDRPGLQAALDTLASTFVFPAPKAAQAAVAQAEAMTPAQKVAQDILFGANPPSSADQARERLERSGMVPVGRGGTGTFYGFPSSSPARDDGLRDSRPSRGVSNSWYFIDFIGGIYWGISFASGAPMSPALVFLAPPLVCLFQAAVAIGRFDPGRVILGALALYVNFMISFAIGYGVSSAGFVRFHYNPPKG